MTESATKMANWYKVKFDDVYSSILEYIIVRVTPNSVTYLAPWHDPRELPRYARFRANKVRLRMIDGIQYGEKKDKIECNKHHWFDTKEKAKQCLLDYCYDKIKHHQSQIGDYQHLLGDLNLQ